ncbi:3',5'-cyclic-AMP phosphodiesterase [Endozoicomonas ascidiicola]|uniref:3',5'-cyclic-AMP phosphodiesterase n=1 Tax=Endozoicomonas ascidiicola TaxID=1698521 RepID=UPI00082F67DD|nr:3',5'-cyclic-AMP phosphodiesterase [Endozoicomonas ascidiicola]
MSTKKIQVLQITDTHLFASSHSALMGVDTAATFEAVLKMVKSDFYQAQCVLVTGDLTQDDSADSYHYLKDALSDLPMPNYWLCGNHDREDLMNAISPAAMKKKVELGNWQILLLNSQVPNQVYGHLEESELAFLSKELAQNPDKPTLIALHHHPAPINSQWMDNIMLKNPDEFAAVLNNHKNIKGIIHGHIHQAIDYTFCGIPVMATPSTCVQFAPESNHFQADTQQPGFRVIDLMPDGTIETQVIRICDQPMEIDLRSKGY